jgi:peptide chain release factor 1
MELPEARLKEMEARFEEVERLLGDPVLATRPGELRVLGREHSHLKGTVEAWREYRRVADDLAEARAMLSGSSGEERSYVESEIEQQEARMRLLSEQIVAALIQKDPNDDRDVIVEIRGGAGGEEAGLFAADLYRMYSRYAESKHWKAELLSSNETGTGGLKEITFAVKGNGAYSRLKHEAGVHRVQRVPVTESSGRMCIVRAVRVVNRSTPRIRPCASATYLPGLRSRARTRSLSFRTKPRRCASCARGCCR